MTLRLEADPRPADFGKSNAQREGPTEYLVVGRASSRTFTKA